MKERKNQIEPFPQMDFSIDWKKYGHIFLNHWKLILIVSAVIVGLTLIYILIVPPKYQAKAGILAGQSKDISGLRSIAEQFGLVNFDESVLNSPEVYKEIIRSRNLIDVVAKKKFPVSKRDTLLNLVDLYKIKVNERKKDWSEKKISFLLYKKILKSLTIKTDIKTPIVWIFCETIDPLLSATVIEAIIEELDNFNNQVRNVKARKNLEFIEKRLDEIRGELQKAEENLKEFQLENKRITDSPELQLALGRLIRNVKMQEELYITLSKERELAKIEEIKEAPIIDIIETPVPPVIKSYPKIGKIIIFLFFLIPIVNIIVVVNIERILKIKNQVKKNKK